MKQFCISLSAVVPDLVFLRYSSVSKEQSFDSLKTMKVDGVNVIVIAWMNLAGVSWYSFAQMPLKNCFESILLKSEKFVEERNIVSVS